MFTHQAGGVGQNKSTVRVCVKTASPDEWTEARTHEWTIGQAKRLLGVMK
jgi:hypothetical protein